MKGWILALDHHEPKKIPHLVGERITQLSSISFVPAADVSTVPKSSVAIVSLEIKSPSGDITEVPLGIFSATKMQTLKLDLRFLMEEVTAVVRYRQGKPSGTIALAGVTAHLA